MVRNSPAGATSVHDSRMPESRVSNRLTNCNLSGMLMLMINEKVICPIQQKTVMKIILKGKLADFQGVVLRLRQVYISYITMTPPNPP